MIDRLVRPLLFVAVAVSVSLFASCTVDQNASLETATGAAKKKESETETISWAEKNEARKAERELKRVEAEKAKAEALAAKKKEDAKEARRLAAEKKAEEAKEKAIAAREAREAAKSEGAETKAEAAKLAEKEAKKEAKLAAKEKAKADRDARRLAEETADEQIAATEESSRTRGGGFFSRMNNGTPAEYKSEGHDVYVNRVALASLSPSNAKIEIDISEQRARVYKSTGGIKQLVIDTRVSTGKSGHSTPTGTWKIKEKLVSKRSSLYGRWVNSSGGTVQSSGDSRSRPGGGSSFVGAEMPYWMRVTGGIGMHIGYVPDYPASHGCIRVPAAVQPLIYSKVGVGTSVTISY